jgi:rubrerythrin
MSQTQNKSDNKKRPREKGANKTKKPTKKTNGGGGGGGGGGGAFVDLYKLQMQEPASDSTATATAAAAAVPPPPADLPLGEIKVKEEKAASASASASASAAAAPPAEVKTRAQLLKEWEIEDSELNDTSKEVLIEILNSMLEDLDSDENKNSDGEDDSIENLSDWFDTAFDEYDFHDFDSEFDTSDIRDAGYEILNQLVDALKERKIFHVPRSSFLVRDSLLNEFGVPLDYDKAPIEEPAAKRVKRSATPEFKDARIVASEDIMPSSASADKQGKPRSSKTKSTLPTDTRDSYFCDICGQYCGEDVTSKCPNCDEDKDGDATMKG